MTAPPAADIPTAPAACTAGAGRAAAWSLGWLIVVGGAAGWSGAKEGLAAPATEALALAAAPAALSAIAAWRRWRWVGLGSLLAWAAAATAAVWICGGAAGPLAPLALAPLLAGVVLGGVQAVAAGAALASASAAVLALAVIAGDTPPPATAPWLAFFAFALVVFGLAPTLVLAHAGEARAVRRRRHQSEALWRVLERHSVLVLDLDRQGAVRSAYGLGRGRLWRGRPPARFVQLGADPAVLGSALERASTCDRLEVFFDSATDPAIAVAAVLERAEDGFVAVLRDDSLVSEREEALSRAAAEARAQNEGKSRFLANMSHELRTPLNAIVGFSDIMRAQMFGPLTPKYAEYAQLIHESGGHLLDLINDVLDLSKIEAQRYELTKERFDAREAVSAALRLVRVQADSANVRLRGLLPAVPLEVDADRRALKQIVLNLASNALKFTPSGGQAKVVLQVREGELEIIVADTGVGISTADLERLGRPFEQAGDAQQRAGGSGLGLSLVRAFCALHGGGMRIESALGEGTVVGVRLPVLAAAAPVPRPSNSGGGGEAAIAAAPPPNRAGLADNVIPFSPERRTERR